MMLVIEFESMTCLCKLFFFRYNVEKSLSEVFWSIKDRFQRSGGAHARRSEEEGEKWPGKPSIRPGIRPYGWPYGLEQQGFQTPYHTATHTAVW